MTVDDLKTKWKQFVNDLNAKGIPLPLIRLKGEATFSGTLAFISFNIWVLSAIGKASGYLGGMNPNDCLNMFLACAGLYFGRKFQSDGTKKSLDDKIQGESGQ